MRQLASLILILYFCYPAFCQHMPIEEASQHLDSAISFRAVGNSRAAEEECKLAINIQKSIYPEAWRELCWVLAGKLRFEEATAAFQTSIKQSPQVNPQDLEILNNLQKATSLQFNINNTEKPELLDLIEFTKDVLLFSDNQEKEALTYAEKTVAMYPSSAKAHLLIAQILKRGGSEKDLFYHLNQSINLDSTDPQAHFELAYCLYLKGTSKEESENAITECHKALELSSMQLIDAWKLLSLLFLQLGKKEDSLQAIQTYIHLSKTPIDSESKHILEMLN